MLGHNRLRVNGGQICDGAVHVGFSRFDIANQAPEEFHGKIVLQSPFEES